jgi:hypothetical protein
MVVYGFKDFYENVSGDNKYYTTDTRGEILLMFRNIINALPQLVVIILSTIVVASYATIEPADIVKLAQIEQQHSIKAVHVAEYEVAATK